MGSSSLSRESSTMLFLILSLVVILNSVDAKAEAHWGPFPPFPLHQFDYFHGHGSLTRSLAFAHFGAFAATPVYPTFPAAYQRAPYRGFQGIHQTPVYNQRIKTVNPQQDSAITRIPQVQQNRVVPTYSAPTADSQQSRDLGGVIPSNEFTSGNIVQQAKAQAKSTLSILKSFEGSDIAAKYIDPIFETSDCLKNLEDVTQLIEEGTNLIVENGPEIIYLEALVDNLKDEEDINKLIKASSKMLRTLDTLIPNLSAASSNLCISTPEASVKAFKDLATAFKEINKNTNLNVPSKSKKVLEFSSRVMDQTAEFLETLNKSLEMFEAMCESDNKNQAGLYTSIIDIMESLAGLFEVMGFQEKSADILKQGKFIKKFVAAFDGLDSFESTLECGFGGSYTGLAQTLDDLAEIVESVGIEKLSKTLGIDIDFGNSV